MTRRQQTSRFLARRAACSSSCCWSLFRQILLPFVAGAALAYALDPVADWLERSGFNRLGATTTILSALLVVVFVAGRHRARAAAGQPADRFRPAACRAISRACRNCSARRSKATGREVPRHRPRQASARRSTSFIEPRRRSRDHADRLDLDRRARVVDVLSLLVVTPVVAFYLLCDWDAMIARVDRLLPRDQAEEMRELAREIDQKVAASCAASCWSASCSASSMHRPRRDRPELRPPDRPRVRHPELHSLPRLHRRLRPVDRHRARAVLAGLDLACWRRWWSSSSASCSKATSSSRG